ncbi:hypothetical protein SEA_RAYTHEFIREFLY_49 [Gordonia phage RayTheFireFly]|nr:hypothetical protein SEA_RAYTHEFIREFLY_49 [Gordonia phage RayTheFireFly]
MIAVSDQEAAGSLAGAAVAEGKAADCAVQSFPDLDTADLLAVCDLDVDAVVGWQVWQALRTEAIANAAISAVTQLLRWIGAPPSEADQAKLSALFDPRGI